MYIYIICIFILVHFSSFRENLDLQIVFGLSALNGLLGKVYDGVCRVSGLRRGPVVSVKNPTLIPIPH